MKDKLYDAILLNIVKGRFRVDDVYSASIYAWCAGYAPDASINEVYEVVSYLQKELIEVL